VTEDCIERADERIERVCWYQTHQQTATYGSEHRPDAHRCNRLRQRGAVGVCTPTRVAADASQYGGQLTNKLAVPAVLINAVGQDQ